MNLLAFLATVNDKGVSVSKDTLVVIVLILAIIALLLYLFSRRWHR